MGPRLHSLIFSCLQSPFARHASKVYQALYTMYKIVNHLMDFPPHVYYKEPLLFSEHTTVYFYNLSPVPTHIFSHLCQIPAHIGISYLLIQVE